MSSFRFGIRSLFCYFANLTVGFHDISALFGFCTFLVIANQLVSGTMLAFSLVPETMLVSIVRNEEDMESYYTDDFFWLHERGVDYTFIFVFMHLFRKLYLNVYEYETEASWKSGAISFILLQVVVFFGLVLCSTHLSEVTLVIAYNIFQTFFMEYGYADWWFFTNHELNTDTLIRLAYLHYISAFFLGYIGIVHGVEMHYDWKSDTSFNGLDCEMQWWDEAFINELMTLTKLLVAVSIYAMSLFTEPEALAYEMFMWGDVGMTIDVRFYSVAPHWYFRPFMAWLIACPSHEIGVFGLLFFFFSIFYQPVIQGTTSQNNYGKKFSFFVSRVVNQTGFFETTSTSLAYDLYKFFFFYMFITACFYAASFLPYGRFYNRVQGNKGLLLTYIYLFMYLGYTIFRRNSAIDTIVYSIYARTLSMYRSNYTGGSKPKLN